MKSGFSVVMPTYNQVSFIRRAILSLFDQDYKDWELIIIDDGCTDNTETYISDILCNPKVRYIKLQNNCGLGAALNIGIKNSKYEYIAYLPSDDFYHKNHLELLKNELDKSSEIILAFSGVKFFDKDSLNNLSNTESSIIVKGYCLQLVQVAHRKNEKKWIERDEFITEDLFLMYWSKLVDLGYFSSTNIVTSYWTTHRHQRNKIVSEKYGGNINLYRDFYKVKTPIKLRMSKYKFVNEEKLYSDFQEKFVQSDKSLKILIVGELSYNPERIYALEELGHKLYGLWVPRPSCSFSNIGHLSFGNIEDISFDNWKEKVDLIKPDIIYAMSSWVSVEFVYNILKETVNIPFVFHFKESPVMCQKNGNWNCLANLYRKSDGVIFINKEIKGWYEQYVGSMKNSFIMDLDPPKNAFFTNDFSDRLSESDDAIHTVIVGRMIGFENSFIKKLVDKNIHIHLYSESNHYHHDEFNKTIKNLFPNHFHIHHHCNNKDWVKEFSKYDAGWLHCFDSKNYGQIRNASWDDLNLPARIYTLTASGLPSIQKDNSEHSVAIQSMVNDYGIGIFFKDVDDLSNKLKNKSLMDSLRRNVLDNREKFTFDYYAPYLVDFFKKVINNYSFK